MQISYPDSERKDRSAGARGEIPVLMINTLALKDQLNVMLDRTSAGGGRINMPDWLPDWWFAEMVAEVRNADGWVKKSPRNEAWDLLVYAIALSLYRPIKIEHLDWNNPPGWAAEWGDNDLVFFPEERKTGVIAEPKGQTLEELAALLA